MVKQKGFYTYEYMRGFGSLKKDYQAKKGFIVPRPVQKFVTMNMNMFLRFRISLKIKAIKDYHDLYLK